MIEDAELLRRYAEERSDAAFTELVRRRVNLVYSVALRQVGGDAHLAEDVTQRVFTHLARKAQELSKYAVLTGWLYRSAQYAASDVVRTERRRRAREQEAQIMNEMLSPVGSADWEKSRPLIDEVLGELDAEDRDALALRFFEERSFVEIGAAVRLTEDAARKRVSRALDKLHGLLARRGVNSTTAALGLALAGQTSVAAPAGFAATVATGALAGAVASGAAAAGAAATFIGFVSAAKIATGVAGVVACVAIGVVVFEAKTAKETQATSTALVPEGDRLPAKLPDMEDRLAASSQQAATAQEDIDKLSKNTQTLQSTMPPNVSPGVTSMSRPIPAPMSPSPSGPITRDLVETRYRRAQELARAGQREEALQEFLWCYDEGMPAVPSYGGVRTSFLLSAIEKLGSPGLAALGERREVAQKRMLAGERGATLDFVSINRTLKQDDLTMAIYDQLPPGDSRRKTLANAAYELLISHQRYADAAQARNYTGMSRQFELSTEPPVSTDTNAPDRIRQLQRDGAIKSMAANIEVLAGAGDLINARKLAAQLLAFDGSAETRSLLQQHLTRAGQPALLSENSP